MYAENGRCDVDEPVGQERCDSQEDDVERQILIVLGDLFGPLLHTLRTVALNERPTETVGEQVAQRCTDCGAL